MRWLILFCLCSHVFAVDCAVTYDMSGGRLGDNLISYLHAKWVAKKYQLPLLYKPFHFSDQFVFHDIEHTFFANMKDSYLSQMSLIDFEGLKILPPGSLVIIPYFRSDKPELMSHIKNFDSPWDTLEFRQFARELIKPRFSVNTIAPPEDSLNVLVHVRTGGGVDKEKSQLKHLLKFPPLSFYLDALEILSAHFAHPRIYAFVMTDDKEPLNLLAFFKEKMAHRGNMEFDCRPMGGPEVNVLDDFFSVPAFDCLIRADSNFTLVASLLADFKMVIYPKKAHLEEKKVFVDEIEIVTETLTQN